MRNTKIKRILLVGATLLGVMSIVGATFFVRNATSHAATPTSKLSAQQIMSEARSAHVGGVYLAANSLNGGHHKPPPEDAFFGQPPLLFNGADGAADCFFNPCDNGNVMMTASTGPVVVVPIYWDPAGSMTAAYKGLITSYLGDVAKDSGGTQNVFSVDNEYFGNNGQIHYNVRLGPVITDTNAIPTTGGCILDASDTTGIYADGSGYSNCIDDNQLTAEIDSVTAANGLPHDLSHIYVMYLPKGLETCFFAGSTLSGNACTINHNTAAYCAYHSTDNNSAVYANLSYPIYASPIGFTCGSDARFPVLQSPNHNPDGDVEISPTMHEINEAITDPDVETGWYDVTGNENGDECAYFFGSTGGAPGAYFNQVINGGKFLTQLLPSNKVFASSGGISPCVPSQSAEH